MPSLSHKHFSLGTVLYASLLTLIIGSLITYAIFQARSIIIGPEITLSPEPEAVIASSTALIHGKARNIVALSLNGKAIFTDDAGNFSETLVLPNGYTIMTLTARDRYGRETNLTRTLVRREVP